MKKQTLWIAVGVVVLAVIVIVVMRRHARIERPDIVRDVPRLEGSAIVYSPGFQQRAGLAFSPVKKAPFRPSVRVVGTVAFNPNHVAAIGTRLRGTVRRTFKYEGDEVVPGDALAEIESGELGDAQASVTQARANLDAAEINARREKDLLERNLTTAREAEVASADLAIRQSAFQAAQQRVKALGGNSAFGVFVLKAPITGHVVEVHVAPGQSVDTAVIAYKIANLDHLWIELSVFERDLPMIHVGDEVDVSPLGDQQTIIQGKVAHVGEVIDPTTRSTDIRVTIDYPAIHLRPGQSVHATITSDTNLHDAVLVPQSSVVYVDGKPTVFVVESTGRVHATSLRLGTCDATRHEVLEGVEPGQDVVSSGVFALKSELFR